MTTEVWTNDPPEVILEKIKWNTHQVKFVPFNIFKKKTEIYSPWIGQIDEKKLSFKLFRVTSPDHTSDFSVEGQYEIRAGKGLVKIRHKVYFTSILGLAGLLTFVFAIWFLLQKKGILMGNLFLVLGLILTGGVYSVFILRDLNKNDAEIREVLERIWLDDETEEQY
ncbi:MAG TPA: hypothetical protein PLJ60_12970 [Chryseolinea sp.]|nr:hypothetical protein [Chryseolinea sp.]HPH46498.1 hypothetical protein [Chryseolinea sp.]HPM31239.1 hypothetical protein [Chryseolinea sp.]